MICDSIKVKDPMKVGRFGLGFKSVFHMTGKQSTSMEYAIEMSLISSWYSAGGKVAAAKRKLTHI